MKNSDEEEINTSNSENINNINENNIKENLLLNKNNNKNNINDEKINIPEPKIEGFTYDPYLESNFFSRFFFYWCYKVLKLSKKTKITPDLLGNLCKQNDSEYFSIFINQIWEDKKYKKCKSNALFKAILRANVFRLITVFILIFLSAATEYFSVILIKYFIDYFDPEEPKPHIFNYYPTLNELGLIFLINSLVNIYSSIHSYMKQGIFGTRASFELSCFIYNKLLKISPSSFQQRATQGEILNFIQVDCLKLAWMMNISPYLIICPIKIVAYIYLLFRFFKLSFLAGLFFLIVFFSINLKIFKMFRIIQKEFLKKKDERMKITTETFDNIKLLKLYNWEKAFMKKILISRDNELVHVRRRLNITTTNISLFWLCPSFVSIITMAIYQYTHAKFNISTMLIGLSLFSRLQDPIRQLPSSINNFLEVMVSMKRIEKFLRQTDTKNKLLKINKDNNTDIAIKITKGCFSWGVKQEKKEETKNNKKKKEKENNNEEKDKDKDDNNNINEENNDEEEILNLSDLEDEDDESDNNINEDINNLTTSLIPKNERTSIENLISSSATSYEINETIKEGCKIQIHIPKKIKYDIVLKNINLEIKKGEIVAIIGEVGSGKSSLLQAMLNSLILLNPKECDGIHINGSIGYVAQIPWIQNETIRNNILFFNDFNEEKYKEILEVSQLNYDLDNFEGGDKTEIGEKGVNLSGGQKVRVSLARILYQNPDIYLLDDPISALDANVGKKIMKDCIIKYLNGKTRIVVTHALHYLNLFEKIIYIKEGTIKWIGTYDEIKKQEFFLELNKLTKIKNSRKDSIDSNDSNENNEDNNNENNEMKNTNKNLVKITKDEDEEVGSVKFSIYIKYAKYMGGVVFMISIILIMIFWQINKGGSDLWLAYWSKPDNQEISANNKREKWIFFVIYSGLSIASILFIFLRIYFLTVGILKLSRYCHKDMIVKLIKAPINLFHETIPRGQIYNRLSKDIEYILYSIFDVGDFLVCFFGSFGALILCSIYDPYSIFFIPFMFVLGYFITSFYLCGSRPLTRLEAISRSPILNTLSETIPGNTTIRAFEKKNNYLKKFYNKINDCFKINICIRGINYWFQEVFSMISFIYLFYLVMKTIYNEDNITAQQVGITFTYSVVLQYNLGWSFSCAANMENNMVSMERCIRYTTIEGEKPSKIPKEDNKLKLNKWPKKGTIRFENFSVKYRPNTEIILKNINFCINSNEKVGVVGRTGSGKSTICLCLFRILEPLTGTIYIDDVDITKIGLDILRKSMTIIPQDPCLFEGTLKYNIDPFNINSDEEIIKILKEIGFEYKEDDKKILNKLIEQNGNNLSVGEKQLVCIARAILRKSKIIVMDEATANIDIKTEEKIQKALNLVFDNSTVITVAHRIKTIINYDKILVLDNGEIIEFDSPKQLLKNENSLFFKLYQKSTL